MGGSMVLQTKQVRSDIYPCTGIIHTLGMSLSHLEPLFSIHLFSTLNCISSTSCYKTEIQVLYTSNPYKMHRNGGSWADLQQSTCWVRSCLNQVRSARSSLKWTATKRWIVVATVWEFPWNTLWKNLKEHNRQHEWVARKSRVLDSEPCCKGYAYRNRILCCWGGTSHLLGKRPEREFITLQVPF